MSLRNIRFMHAAIRREAQALADVAGGDGTDLTSFTERLGFFRSVLRVHEAGEEAALFPALDRYAPGIEASFAAEHEAVRDGLARVDAALDEGDATGLATAMAAAAAAIQRHVDREEDELLDVADAHLGRREQWRVAGETVRHVPFELRYPMIRWMVSLLTVDERVGAIQMWRSAMPPEPFAGVLGVVRESLPAAAWDELEEQLPELVFYPPLHVQLLQMLTGSWVTNAISALADLGIPDRLTEGSRTAAELAAEVEADPAALYRLLRALTVVGILSESPEARFSLTPLSQYLRSAAQPTMRPLARWAGHEAVTRPWQALTRAVREGGVASEKVFGTSYFEYLAEHPEAAGAFNDAMTGFTMGHATALLASYDLADATSFVDVGGGQGLLLGRILSAYPAARGVLFDQPSVVAGAGAVLGRFGVADRVSVVGGDFFEAVPEGGDVYLLKMILHDWSDADAVRILAKVRAAMPPSSRLLVLEGVVPPAGAGDFTSGNFTRMLDLEMLVLTGGRERTRDEYAALADAAGLQVHAVVPTESVVQVIDLRPA